MNIYPDKIVSLVISLICTISVLLPVTSSAKEIANLNTIYGNQQQRPVNVVLILFDWARRDAIGVYSNKDVSTPNIDKLAKQGLIFNNAHVQYPLCGPSRVSFMTGLYPDQTKSKKLRLYVR